MNAEKAQEATSQDSATNTKIGVFGSIAGLMIVIGVFIAATRPSRWESNVWETMQNVQLEVKPADDGKGDLNFGSVVIKQEDKKSITNLFEYCETHSSKMHSLILKAIDEGNEKAKIMACRLIFYLGPGKQNEPVLSPDDLNKVSDLLTAGETNSDGTPTDDAAEVQRVAQWALSRIIFIEGEKAKELFEKLPAEDEKTLGEDQVELQEIDWNGQKVYRPYWANPKVCAAWWKAHGGKVKWNDKITYFSISN